MTKWALRIALCLAGAWMVLAVVAVMVLLLIVFSPRLLLEMLTGRARRFALGGSDERAE